MYKGTSGTITSPGFPNKYPHKKTCIWSIRVPKGKVVTFQFSLFDVENHSFCKYDYLEIRDGWENQSPQLGRYCTTRPPYGKINVSFAIATDPDLAGRNCNVMISFAEFCRCAFPPWQKVSSSPS